MNSTRLEIEQDLLGTVLLHYEKNIDYTLVSAFNNYKSFYRL